MTLKSLIRHIQANKLTEELASRLDREEKLIIKSNDKTSRGIIATSISNYLKKSLMIIAASLEEAARWQSTLESMGWSTVYIYPTSENSPYEKTEISSEIEWGQLQVLTDLATNSSSNDLAIVTTERALEPHLPSVEILSKSSIVVQKNTDIDIDKLSVKLSDIGYSRKNTTEMEGTWSRRGDIIDIFPVSSELPIRLELYGDTVDKIREYDPVTQRSLDEVDVCTVSPTSIDFLIAKTITNKSTEFKSTKLDDDTYKDLEQNKVPKGIRRYIGIAWPEVNSILDYIKENTLVLVDEKTQCLAHSNEWINYVEASYNEFIQDLPYNRQKNALKIEPTLHKGFQYNYNNLNKYQGLDMTELEKHGDYKNYFDINAKSIPSYANQFGKLSDVIKKSIHNKFAIWILSAQPSRVKALLEEHDCICKFLTNPNDLISVEKYIKENTPVALKAKGQINIEGINLAPWNTLLITDREFFGQQLISSTAYIRRRRSSSSKAINPSKLMAGDYVVHRNHGIGKFLKIEKFVINNESRDYLLVQYQDGTLRVAADQLGSLGRFRSSTDKKPNINKLGGTSWQKTKERAIKAINKVAIDLIKLYAERLNTKGFAYPHDGPWQTELEEAFQYQPTTDQIKAVDEVKHDMEKDKPMDRLICGDVGFGKTEVAIRALFKAITAGKQVALLAPTTILSQQHWRTLSDRYAPYPIKVSLLNRFKSAKEKKQIVDELRNGKIDAIIGTHVLLSKKVIFKNLGLLVVDEEQRFGVRQKERIKELKTNIDVLTLTATPIPRTLYMSLSGVRSMSLITTPPPLRRSIKTHLTYQDEEVIRSAICQELDRGGQIFYVVPRVEGIEEVAKKIKDMIPTIKIIVAHGQMVEGQLESSMIAFNAGEGDLMLCTTIVESGLDIPRVNTILIEDSHQFGLSQLYQLRGRVGRSGVQAHAWLFYPKELMLNDSAKQRLRAIQQFSELGSGYQLAMRDMEIRGVGNLIGTQQSGQMEAIGFDLYMEMLHEKIAEIQGAKIPIVDETTIDLQLTAFIPANWIKENDEKISAYKAASECSNKEQLVELVVAWTDRYGKPPKAVESLIQVMELKLVAKKCGFYRIKPDKTNIILETKMDEITFKKLRGGIPSHLQGRFIYKKTSKNSEVLIRGVGLLPSEKQIDQLIEWLIIMKDTIDAK